MWTILVELVVDLLQCAAQILLVSRPINSMAGDADHQWYAALLFSNGGRIIVHCRRRTRLPIAAPLPDDNQKRPTRPAQTGAPPHRMPPGTACTPFPTNRRDSLSTTSNNAPSIDAP